MATKEQHRAIFQEQRNSLQMAVDALHGLGLDVPRVAEITLTWAKQATQEHSESVQQRAKSYARKIKWIVEAWFGIEWLEQDDGEIVVTATSLASVIAQKVAEQRRKKASNNY